MTQRALQLYTAQERNGTQTDGESFAERRPGAAGDGDLFRSFLLGSDPAFNALYLRRSAQIQTYCRKMLRDSDAAEDVAQETWIRVVDMRRKPPADTDNPMRLILRIARNLCLDELKAPRTRNRRPIDEVDLSSYAEEHAANAADDLTSLETLVLICLNRLDFDYRETLVLNMYCGYSFEEIAGMLGKSPRAIWQRASRARKKLRTMIEKEMERD